MKYNRRKLNSHQLKMAYFSSPLSVLWLLVVPLKIRAIIFLHFHRTYQLIKTEKKIQLWDLCFVCVVNPQMRCCRQCLIFWACKKVFSHLCLASRD